MDNLTRPHYNGKPGEYSLEMNCTADGSPEPTYQWFFMGPDKSQELLVSNEGKFFIPNLKMGDDQSVGDYGYYKCVASNHRGSANVTVFLQMIKDEPVQEISYEKDENVEDSQVEGSEEKQS